MKLKVFSFLLFFLYWLVSVVPTGATTVSDLRISTFNTGVVRLVLETDSRADINIFSLSNPDRLVLDVPDAVVSKMVQQKKINTNKIVLKTRFGKPKDGLSRIVLDLTSPVSESHFILPPQSNVGTWRFVLDLVATGTPVKNTSDISKSDETQDKQRIERVNSLKEKSQPSVVTEVKKVVEQKQPSKKASVGLLPFSGKSKKVVMLDPGHGGQDPGAISKSGHYEKDLTLKMARETRKLLEKAGYKVVMTRDSDVYVTLRGRVKKAHAAKADLFISIHADSTTNRSAKGLSIYTISETASDKEAAALAERENKSDILLGMDLGDYQQEVSSVLIDLAKQDTMKESRRYAGLVVGEMRQTVQLVPNAHRFAGFAVLKSPNIPSVLLEMGYLSNKQEERLLQKESYRKKLGEALVKAVNAYFKELGN